MACSTERIGHLLAEGVRSTAPEKDIRRGIPHDEQPHRPPGEAVEYADQAVRATASAAWPMSTALRVRDVIDERNGIAVVVGLGCGLRRGEVFGLSPDDIDSERGMLHVRCQVQAIHGRLHLALPKGKKIRAVDLPPL